MITFRYAVIQFFFWFAFGNVTNFASVYLLDCGMTNTQIGILSAAACVISVLIQPMLAGYADKEHSPSLKVIISAFSLVQILLGVLLYITYQKTVVLTGLFYGCAIVIIQMLTPFVNALGTESIRQGKKLNFSIARGLGSVGYAVMAFTLGRILSRFGAGAQSVSMIIVSLAFLISVGSYPFRKERKPDTETEKENSGNPISFFRKYKSFGYALLGCILVYISHIFLNSFTYQITVSKGGGSGEMGTAMAIASLVELPIMFLFTFMLRKAKSVVWFRISGIFFTLKTLGTLLAWNVTSFYAVQLFQMFGWALITVSSVYYVDSIMMEKDKIKGQTYMTMSYTIASVIGSLAGGTLLDWCGVSGMLIAGTAIAALGTGIMLLATRQQKF